MHMHGHIIYSNGFHTADDGEHNDIKDKMELFILGDEAHTFIKC